MTKQEIETMGAEILANDPSALMKMIDTKSKMQAVFTNQMTTSEAMEAVRNVKNQNVISKIYKLGALEMQKTVKSNKNYYITSLVIGTILKEIYEDQRYITADSLYSIINNIKKYE